MAFTPAERAGEVRAALAEIVAEHGPEALSRPALMTSLLADLLPESPGPTRLVVAAAQDRVAAELRSHVAQGLDAATAARLVTSSFATSNLYAPEVCAWVVGEFAVALGLITEAGWPAGAVPGGPEPAAPAPGHARPEPETVAVPEPVQAAAEAAAVTTPARQVAGGGADGPATLTGYPPGAGAARDGGPAQPVLPDMPAPPPRRGPRFRPSTRMSLIAGGLAVAAAAAAAVIIVDAPGGTRSIASVAFSGTGGFGVTSPKITITGAHFGTTAPSGTSDNSTSCGDYTANGRVYGNKLSFVDGKNFEAGVSNGGGADCVGIKVVSWSQTKVVLKFGNAYGTFDHWFLTNGDGFAISIKTAHWDGKVSGLN